jgi:hypothetical protein
MEMMMDENGGGKCGGDGWKEGRKKEVTRRRKR